MKTLSITWQRLLDDGKTCPRCGSTEIEVEKAVALLTQSLAPLGITVVLAKSDLNAEQFAKDTLQSNRIQIDGKLLEEWIGGETGQSQCCEVCGPNDCRTMTVESEVLEVIPAELIVKAGLLAAAQILSR
ncbi:DUF2703 domain-containing protein [Geobacter sp. SVR]|uniref:DUF2703 domain-containing protein n=1 Tax=Geobacter sp. SVR TaxID=2495594 RepID=UPI00143EF56E|nr:DUF2703 domain-containing protein [Geobacter sp. SVR]BCS51888.1 hypothetical protein GSVR_01960 [Geobacter sp. SVR]GCF87728.1 hypothetical protein GSbR_43280 [Geobacter sp. SVR]